MLNIHFTLAMVVEALSHIAKREPGRIGKEDGGVGCVYAKVQDGVLVPICIVGQWFADMGLLRLMLVYPNDFPSEYVPNITACDLGSDFWNTLASFGITADEEAMRFAHAVQMQQDDDLPWGEAFNRGVERFRRDKATALDLSLDDTFRGTAVEAPLAEWERELLAGDAEQPF